ncbi:hypothetical protein [Paraburkholderia saeva]|uniref:Uncharacterized protein n=1 Tax=Paraburkholderia saeva TaxID=2777537 RepID=A0A9N8RW82_9BURK|nr:hypothetical protein [Paraburkholderia saeva]CAG4900747.1 hypothetical protein LMG31841_02913 [Paraburkholderia saeva]
MSDIQADPQVQESQTPPADPVVAEPEVKAQPDTSWVPKRISEITAARRAAEQRAEQAEDELARLRAGQQMPVEGQQTPQQNQSVDQLARAYAERMVRDQREQDNMTTRIAAINEAGTKEFGDDFDKSVQNLNMAGIGGPEFLRVLTNVPNAEKVVTWLGKDGNINEAMRIASMDPIQMGIEMTKLSSRATKELAKQISKVPPPPTPVDGGSGGDGSAPDPKDTKAWIEYRNKTARKKR